MNQKIKNYLMILSIFVISLFLAYVFSPLGGMLYRFFWKFEGCSILSIGCDKGAILEGFVYFYIFWLAVLSFAVFSKKKAVEINIVGTFLLWVFNIFIIFSEEFEKARYISSFVIMICFLVFGYLLGIGVNKYRKDLIENNVKK